MKRLKFKILIQVSVAILVVELVLLVVSVVNRGRTTYQQLESNPATASLPVAEKKQRVQADARAYAIRIGGMITLVISGTVVLVYFRLNRLVLQPIQRLIDSNLALASSDHENELIREGDIPDDEIGEIIRTRQIMLDSLRHTEHRLRLLNEELEGKVTERTKELERALQEVQSSHRRLVQSEKMIMMGTLSAGIIHELTQPMTVLVHSLGELDELINLHPEECQLVSNVRARCEDVCTSLNSLRQFSRQPTARHSLDVNKVVERVMSLIRHQLSAGKYQVAVELNSDIPPVLGDEVLIKHCLLNLIANARDALAECPPPDGRHITIRSRAEGEDVLLDVIDNGSGMSKETLAAIEQPYFTTKSPEQGTGLGLMMVRQMLAELGGRLDVDSTPGRGTRFSLHIPRASAALTMSNEEAHHAA